MFSHCIFCHSRLPGNEAVERFPVGRRIAFDPGRGRLWAVCPECRRWNLAPFEERWEALEELERARVDRGRVVASTDNISLIDAPGVQLVRVGPARLDEESWWRYGQAMVERRSLHRRIRWLENAGMVLVFMVPFDADWLNRLARLKKFGTFAWQGESACIACGRTIERLTFRRAGRMHLTRGDDGGPALHLRCERCRAGGPGEHQLEGPAAEHVLRRIMAYHHHSGASERRVRSAADYIDKLGSPGAVVGELTKTGLRLDRLVDRERRTQGVALEIALNEERERRLLEMELSELEERWREEEGIAAIADGPLTTVAGLDRLKAANDTG